MKTILRLLALLLLAAPTVPAAPEALASEPQWLKLLHYRADGAGWRSSIVSPEFFLAPDGATHPRSELAATLAALAAPAGADPDAHAQCRFPARNLWLRRALGDAAQWPQVACPKFLDWSADERTQAISLVFATGYLANPASYYGHILLKFNAPRSSRLSDLLDVSVNYGAIVPDDVGAVPYILNGVFGGYDGGFSHTEYFFHSHNYGENEHRDLWEYELDLAPDEVRLLTAHAWELVGRRFRYFFFRENCAYRMAELLEVLDGVDVTPRRPWTIPQSLIRNVARAQRDGRPLLREVRHRPSRQSRFHRRYLRLDAEGRRAVARAAASTGELASPRFQALPPRVRADVLDTLIDYFEFRHGGPKARSDRTTSPRAAAALAARFALPAQADLPFPQPPAPHEGRRPGRVAAGAIGNEALDGGIALQWRGAYYDALDADAAHVPHSALGMVDARIAVFDDGARIERLDLVSIESVNPAVSGLPGDDGRSWSLAAGVAQQYLGCAEDCAVARLQGALGRSLRVGPVLIGAQLGGVLQDNRHGEGHVAGRAEASAQYAPGARVRTALRYQHRFEVDGEILEPGSVQAQVRLQLGTAMDLRLEYDHDLIHQGRVLLGWYW
jgi:hypothetical protein